METDIDFEEATLERREAIEDFEFNVIMLIEEYDDPIKLLADIAKAGAEHLETLSQIDLNDAINGES